jgi:hypothetical protein
MDQDYPNRWVEGDFDGDFGGVPHDSGDPLGSVKTVGEIFRGSLKNARLSDEFPRGRSFDARVVRQSLIPEVYASFQGEGSDQTRYEIALADVTIDSLTIRSSRDGDPTQQVLLGRIQGRLRGRLVRIPKRAKEHHIQNQKPEQDEKTSLPLDTSLEPLKRLDDGLNAQVNSEGNGSLDRLSDSQSSETQPTRVDESCRFCRLGIIAGLSVCLGVLCWILSSGREAFDALLLFAVSVSVACIIGVNRVADTMVVSRELQPKGSPLADFSSHSAMAVPNNRSGSGLESKMERRLHESANQELRSPTDRLPFDSLIKRSRIDVLNQPDHKTRSVFRAQALLDAEGHVSTDRIIITIQSLIFGLKRENAKVYRELLLSISEGGHLSTEQVKLTVGTNDDDLGEIISRTELTQRLLSKLRGVDPFLHMEVCERICSEKSLSGLPG